MQSRFGRLVSEFIIGAPGTVAVEAYNSAPVGASSTYTGYVGTWLSPTPGLSATCDAVGPRPGMVAAPWSRSYLSRVPWSWSVEQLARRPSRLARWSVLPRPQGCARLRYRPWPALILLQLVWPRMAVR